MAKHDKNRIDREWSSAASQTDVPGPGAKPPGAFATFARNALHDATCGWDERVAAFGKGAVCELSQLRDVIRGRKSWRHAGEEAGRVSRDALESARQSREAGNGAHPLAALAGGLVPQVALGAIGGGLLAKPLVQAAMAASKSLAEAPEDLATLEGLKTAVPRAGIAGGTVVAVTKGGQIIRRALSPAAEYLASKTLRPLAAKVPQIARARKALVRCRRVVRELPKTIIKK